MKRFLFGMVISLVIMVLFFFFYTKIQNDRKIEFQSKLIAKEIKNVSKLIVTEGNFSEVITYKDNYDLMGEFLQMNKKAIVIVNAEITIAYDLEAIDFDIDEKSKTLFIKNIPTEEIKVSPDIEYYDIQAGYLNNFDANDYNAVNEIVKEKLNERIEKSDLKSNAKNRLISELAKFFFLTNSMGWTLTYNENSIESQEDLELINFLD